MESNKPCESECSEPSTLTTINDDCKEVIFNHLEWTDMINIADTSKQLYTSVCRAFNQKYGKAKIDIGFPIYGDRYDLYDKSIAHSIG